MMTTQNTRRLREISTQILLTSTLVDNAQGVQRGHLLAKIEELRAERSQIDNLLAYGYRRPD